MRRLFKKYVCGQCKQDAGYHTVTRTEWTDRETGKTTKPHGFVYTGK